ncbi:Kdo domain containing protein [Psychroflexus sp. CAK57W]|uniref:lipopolysaccharide kinase InaA family protein n=1 Tax=Psychroflexus curvus TaxID=2873595 RepID=UPI001CCFFB8C|nr:lipopolysaccharide kinase InaA family protein [Psychroflexus curvus]MBZ9628411.1 Kdo domain containing protein [Psychroflexus curvus]MBZ9788142.1 Kdo domain containing protein [Psychroflexus curvus]
MNSNYNPGYIQHKEALLELINSFDSIGTVFGDGDRNLIKTVELEGLHLNIKSFKEPNYINQIVYQYFRKSKARRSFEYASILKEKEIGTPDPIAFFEFKKGIGFGKSFYISEHQLPDLTFRELVQDSSFPNHEQILRAFTRFTFQLHEKGVEFQDHSPGNTLIFIRKEEIYFSLVDLNRMKFKPLDFRERMYNFRRLTPKKEMVDIMSDEYSKHIQKPKKEVFELMWEFTLEFQRKFHRKQKRKKLLKSLF